MVLGPVEVPMEVRTDNSNEEVLDKVLVEVLDEALGWGPTPGPLLITLQGPRPGA